MDSLSLYDRDFYLWTRAQAEALRRLRELRLNGEVDWLNVAEEIETLGRSDLRALRSQLARILEHLLKLQYSPAADPRQKWAQSANDGRREVAAILADSPSLKPRLPELLDAAWPAAQAAALAGLEQDGPLVPALPDDCPYGLDQVTAWEWFPTNRHGLPPARS